MKYTFGRATAVYPAGRSKKILSSLQIKTPRWFKQYLSLLHSYFELKESNWINDSKLSIRSVWYLTK